MAIFLGGICLKSLFVIVAFIFLYILFSTIFKDHNIVGKIGEVIGKGNIKLFGYFGYIDTIILLVASYFMIVKRKIRDFNFLIGWIILILAIFIFQGILLYPQSGNISNLIYSSLLPYIGKMGVWLLFFMSFLIAIILIFPDGYFKEILSNLKDQKILPKREKKLPPLRDIKLQPQKTTQKEIKKDKKQQKTTTKSTNKSKKSKEEKKESSQTDSISNIKIVDELEENKKLLEEIEIGKVEEPSNFKLPKIEFLQKPPKSSTKVNEAQIDKKIKELLDKLKLFKIEGDVVRTYSGPLVTTFEFKPAPHVKVSKILGLQDDLAMALRAETIRIQAPIPGKDVIGIEIPNEEFQTIYLREILESKLFKNSKSPLTIALGKDIVGNPFITDIKKLPHLLIAGTTGSGKSVGINAMLLSLLYRNDPDSLKLMLIDPKRLEFSIYNDIPHLITPVIVEPKKAVIALSNLVKEMDRRYQLMASMKVKNIDGYNQKAKSNNLEKMPYIVAVIDELADLMMTAGKEVEFSIARLAQMARAAGIHLIVATQRPSVDVVTGLIKANFPARLSYKVGQKIDSKVILDTFGAESLLGRGDALFTPPGLSGLVRIHAPWNSEEEIEKVVEFIKAQREPEYDQNYLKSDSDSSEVGDISQELDPLFEEAKEIVLKERKSSISYLQRRLQIGYNRSANIVEQLEKMGILSPPNSKGQREILQ
ncbi:MAG: DNA translocase FtsK [Epsilonproteobacteria bacterium]|nr:DNA translocase FtsK [Campylobacterota bacterium]